MGEKTKPPSPPQDQPKRVPTRDEQPTRRWDESHGDVIKVDPSRDWPDPPPPRQKKDQG
jgi:hypothetical protein